MVYGSFSGRYPTGSFTLKNLGGIGYCSGNRSKQTFTEAIKLFETRIE
jgi:hypothetical protein